MHTRTLLIFFLIVCFVSNFSNGQRDKLFFRNDYHYLEATKTFYKIHTIVRAWKDAKRICDIEGASFFYPEDENEAQIVIGFWNATQPQIRYVYIGISDLLVKGVFVTNEGIPVRDVYHVWAPGDPNDRDNNEDCLILRQEGTLIDYKCFPKNAFICKKTLASLEWNQNCSTPYLDYNFNEQLGRCYKFHSKSSTWNDAYTTCSNENSYLAIINTQLEADHLVALTKGAPKNKGKGDVMNDTVLLGFHDRNDEGWITVRGASSLEDSGYATWGPSQPSQEKEEQCGAMFCNGTLNDVRCDKKAFFICEHEVDTLSFSFDDRFGDDDNTPPKF